jgi:Bacterial regulatory proteins, tetR family
MLTKLLTDRQQHLESFYEHDAEAQPARSWAAAREQIMDAANALFAERGYDEVSIDDIASSTYLGGRQQWDAMTSNA